MMQLHKTLTFTLTITLAFTFTFTLTACDNPSKGCRTDLDCPTNTACILADCRPLTGVDLAASSDAGADLATPADFSPPIPDGWSPDALAASCTFNDDGTIVRSEEPFLV